jgi:uncharacterized membrane protein YjjP (DUF1212 family)
MVQDNERIENKIDQIFEKLTEIVTVSAVHEQKLRDINHRMGDGQQRNVFAQMEMTKRLDNIDRALSAKVDIEEYKDTLREIRDALAKYQKAMMIFAIILVAGGGVVTNVEAVKKLLMIVFGVH